jgi:PAS domain S-box-containing protein
MEGIRSTSETDVTGFLQGGGQMGELIRNFEWGNTPLGPPELWPTGLKTCVQIMLTSRQPIWVTWRPEMITLYNDPYREILQKKHPGALGQPILSIWKEVAHEVEELLASVWSNKKGIYRESQLFLMERNGFPEETYYTFSYTPVTGDSGTTEGIICFNSDDTERIISQRQLTTLTTLGKKLTGCTKKEEVLERLIATITDNPKDFTFALLYDITDDKATLTAHTELGQTVSLVPATIHFSSEDEIASLCKAACVTRSHRILENLTTKIGMMPQGSWAAPPDKAIILPVGHHPIGLLIIGCNPYRLLDEKLISFYELVTDQLSTSLGSVQAFEEERARIAALAEIDRAKTTFFSNISHEFRTPLTLLLGPLEELMHDPGIRGHNKERTEIAFRNANRMQKLVNLLLDFSLIEAGKMEAMFEPVDIVAITEDLASNFRSAIERSGMTLEIEKEEIGAPIYVDVGMWEKIILNLLSNAFKYCMKGSITVSIRKRDCAVGISVADTGTGIPEGDLHRIFERFYRARNGKGRSQEGTGASLAMVKELVKIHGGEISVISEIDKGSCFTIVLPVGSKHLPAKAVREGRPIGALKTFATASSYVDDAMKWLPTRHHHEAYFPAGVKTKNHRKYSVLLADDNQDMRHFVERLLESEFNVMVAHDGEEAFRLAAHHIPDLILSDIMMPELDGFGLLRKLKAHLSTRNIPVIFISARAGEEARVEGIRAGADDYLTKPFSSKELVARVTNRIAISQVRRRTEKEFFNLFLQSPAHIHVMKGPEHVLEFFHPMGVSFTGRDITGMKIREALPAMEGRGYFEMLDQVYYDGITIRLDESKAVFADENGNETDHFFNITYQPWRDLDGNVQGVIQFTTEVTEQVRAKLKIQESEERLRVAMDILELGTWEYDPRSDYLFFSEKMLSLFGFSPDEKIKLADALAVIVEEDRPHVIEAIRETLKPGAGRYDKEYSLINRADGQRKTIRASGKVFFDTNGKPVRVIGTGLDITEWKKAEQQLRESEERFRVLVTSIQQIVWTSDSSGNQEYLSDQWKELTGSPVEEGINHFIDYIHPEDSDRFLRTWREALSTGNPWKAEYRLLNRNTGKYRWMHGNSYPLKDSQGRILKWIGSASDIHSLKEQSHLLEQLVYERTKALKELNESLSSSNEDLQQFAHVASHDLKEPIRKIKTYSNRLQEEFRSHLPEKAFSFLNKIQGASDRMYSMIDGVLSYSSLTSLQLTFETVDLNALVEEIKTDLEVLIHEKKATIESMRLPSVDGAPLLLYQVIYNLINNSIKFSKPDVLLHIKISCSSYSDAKGRFEKIMITDNGIGFDPSQADRIFTTFTRLNSKDKFEGTGLGLSLCRRIVQRHGGRIFAEGKEGVGAKFTILLPARLPVD